MKRAPLIIVLGLGLSACRDVKRDPALAELSAPPVRAVLRAHEADVPAQCTETGLKRVTCWFKSERRGCLYLEVGAAADGPGPIAPMVAPGEPVADLCTRFPEEAQRRLLTTYAGHHAKAELVADAEGARLGWRSGTGSWAVVYLLDGELLGGRPMRRRVSNAAGLSPFDFDDEEPAEGLSGLGASPPVAPLDWKLAPTLLEATPRLLNELGADQRARLVAGVKRRGGEDALLKLLADTTPATPWWETVYGALDEPSQKKAGDRLRAQVQSDDVAAADQAVLDWFTGHPEQEPANYAEILVTQVERAMNSDYDQYDTSTAFLAELVRRSHPRAGDLACRMLGVRAADGLVQNFEGVLSTVNATALSAIATHKTPCPWVGLLLERSACSYELRCTPAGVPEVSEEFAELPVVRPTQNPLCSMVMVQRRLTRPARTDSEYDESQEGYAPGLQLLAAAYAQGPLPHEVVVKNGRRLYRVVGRTPPRPDDDTEAPPVDSVCDVLPIAAEDLACALPPALTEVLVGGCRVRIDDDQQTLRLEDVRSRKTPVDAVPGYGYGGDPYFRGERHHPD